MTDSNQISLPINNWYDRTLLERAVPYFIYTNFSKVKDIPQGNTNIIKFRQYVNLAKKTTPLIEGVTPLPDDMSQSDITTTVKQYGGYVNITDWVDMINEDAILTEATAEQGDQAGNTLDTLARDIFCAGTNVMYASTALARTDITSSMKFTVTEAKKAVKIMKSNLAKKMTRMINPSTGIATVPVNASYIGIIHPATTYDLKLDTGFLPVEKYPSQADVMPGEVGRMDEIRLIETTEAKIFTGAGNSTGGAGGGPADVYATLIFGMDATAITRIAGQAMQTFRKNFGEGDDPINQRMTNGWKATFAAIILNQAWLLRLEHGTSFS